MTKFTTFANDLLDAEFGNYAAAGYTAGTTTIWRVGGTSYSFPMVVRLTTTLCTASGPGTEVSGGSYAGQTMAGSMATAAASGSKANTTAFTFSNMPACTWADVYTTDSTGTPKPVSFKGTPSLAKTVNAGDTALIPIGSFTGQET